MTNTQTQTVREATEHFRRTVEAERRRFEESICEDCDHVKDWCRCEDDG